MKRFRTVLFNGYQRDEVDQYIEALVQELENFKDETNKKLEENRQVLDRQSKLIEELKSKNNSEDEEKEALKERILTLERQKENQTAAGTEQLLQMQKKLEEYEENYRNLANVLVEARLEASRILDEAKEEAETIRSAANEKAEDIENAAHLEAEKYKRETEAILQKKKETDRRNFEQARLNLANYLDGLNRSQSKLIETYNELGALVKKMPIRIDDIFSDQPFQLLSEERKDEDDNL